MGYCLKFGITWVSEAIRHIHKLKISTKGLKNKPTNAMFALVNKTNCGPYLSLESN